MLETPDRELFTAAGVYVIDEITPPFRPISCKVFDAEGINYLVNC